ncbi:hypothetical protein [Candidatus Uabimicrobium amorphum]|uniref:Uncharacterized protein n=1 Tax=Uabimicrobium amorphum TaxID=2596890 RepID=A0A5S9ISD3_UABAM|nr:hypothetical protein [Candidatus Uabimicrobium amorphum]BBM87229.1 hypothetical protein UABAM_05632 [Candidatus Uabimicrobium amorphum]
MAENDIQKREAEYAGFVDQGTRAVLEEAVQKIVETFAQTDALEDILSYLEEMRENASRTDERIKEIQQREKQINDRITVSETSIRNLLQRIQEMEVQISKATEQMEQFVGYLVSIAKFFEQPPLKRMFGRLEVEGEGEEEQAGEEPAEPSENEEQK